MKRGPLDLADAIRALKGLKPDGKRELARILGILGFELTLALKSKRVSRMKRRSEETERATHEAKAPDQPIHLPESRGTLDFEIRSLGRSRRRKQRMEVVDSLGPLDRGPGEEHQPRPPFVPLLDTNRSRAVLSALARVRRPGAPDLEALTDILASRRPLRSLPRVSEEVAIGVDILVDVSENMAVFARDQDCIVGDFRRVLGRHQVRVCRFIDPPANGIVQAFLRSTRVTPARSGGDVVILSDLGVGGCSGPFDPGTELRWRQFTAAAKSVSSNVTALVPYPRQRWPAVFSTMMAVIQWNETISVRSVLAAMKGTKRRMA